MLGSPTDGNMMLAYLEGGPFDGRSFTVLDVPENDTLIFLWAPITYRRTGRITAEGCPVYEFAGEGPQSWRLRPGLL